MTQNIALAPEIFSQEKQLSPEVFTEARKAQAVWRHYSFKERARFIKKIELYISKNADSIASEISQVTSKTSVDALTTEVISSLLACQWYSKNASKYLKPKKISTSSLLFANKRSAIHRVPLGVVGIISPWNYPFTIPFGEVIMGLMAGNAILLKVASNISPIGRMIERIMSAAELPKGLFQVLEGRGQEVSEFLLENKVDKIFFTGSVAVGKKLMEKASKTLTPLSLELGGNDPTIVLADADLERATSGACWGGFQNAGQTCGGIERVYVDRKIYKEFLDLLVKKTQSLRHGTDQSVLVDMGGLTTRKQLETISAHVEDAKAKGAKVVAQSTLLGKEKGLSYPATVLTHVDHSMRVMKEETFGPVLCVMPFNSVEEALALANDSNLALTSSVWSKDHKKAYELAERIEAGVTCLNDHLYTHALSETPWGGWKESGLGRTHGVQGLEEMTHTKLINWDLIPSKRNLFWYPIEKKTYSNLKLVIGFLSPNSISHFITSSFQLVSFAVRKMFTPWKH